MLSLKRCNLDLPAPIDLFSPFSSVLKIVDTCSNIYAMGQAPFIDVDSALAHFGTFDTSMVTFMPPQFCNPALGDYRLFDTSPCAPANNSCGVLIGARDVGCSALFHCGDADGNDIITISDAVYLINYIFAGGPAPVPILVGDSDCNGIVTISDAVYLINYIFAGGATPCAACP